jgi:hypothetical protein
MADKVTTSKKEADPNAAVLEAIDALRQAMLDSGIDAATVEAKLMSVQPNVASVVGNFADLQRGGAAAAKAD